MMIFVGIQVMKFIELALLKKFANQTLRIRYEPSEGSMMIDINTIQALELVQNAEQARSKFCLFGLLNETQSPMGARLLRSNILQPLTDDGTLESRYEAVGEICSKEEMFYNIRSGLLRFIAFLKSMLIILQRSKVSWT